MIDEVMNGITDAISEEFKEGFGIHTEGNEQEAEKPAFFVHCKEVKMEKQLGTRRKMTLLFHIRYLPASATPGQEMNEVFERLADRLELITVEGKAVRGMVECKEISDEALTVAAGYILFVARAQGGECMGGYDLKGGVKDGYSS